MSTMKSESVKNHTKNLHRQNSAKAFGSEFAFGFAIGIGAVFCVSTIAILVYLIWKKFYHAPTTNSNAPVDSNAQRDFNVPDMVISESTHLDGGKFPYSLIEKATGDFNEMNLIGKGGFGKVYKGVLPSGTPIAVKRMTTSAFMQRREYKEFSTEISVLTKVRHRNLVKLLGYCIQGCERLLVYEFVEEGTLQDRLHNWKEKRIQPLTWKHRLVIALDVARGLEYLHSLANVAFVHRDLKTANILLDTALRAKIADFGLARMVDRERPMYTNLAGTVGYITPEYGAIGEVTPKVDVYAFGVVLMELVSGRPALNNSIPHGLGHLVTFFRRTPLDKVADSEVEADEHIDVVICLALQCTQREPLKRPSMSNIVRELSPLVVNWVPNLNVREDFDEDAEHDGFFHWSWTQSTTTAEDDNKASTSTTS